jgi:hypothetical protein
MFWYAFWEQAKCQHPTSLSRLPADVGDRRHLRGNLGALCAEFLGKIATQIFDVRFEPIDARVEPRFEPLKHKRGQAKAADNQGGQGAELRDIAHQAASLSERADFRGDP